MNYTKGEWILDFSEEHNGVISIYVPKKGNIAKIHTRSCDDSEANAYLIAAAPDMYEALKAVITVGMSHFTQDDIDRAEKALSEAEGRNYES